MIGHAPTLSRTNTNGIVWVCQCGAIGDPIPISRVASGAPRRLREQTALAESRAFKSHGEHLEAVRADIAADSERELARIGRLIPVANRLLQRRGRWGHP